MTVSRKLVEGKFSDLERLWLLLSYFYLDTNIDDTELKQLIQEIDKLPFSRTQVKQIQRAQVSPVLRSNLLGTGDWLKFDEERTVKQITKFVNGLWYKLFYSRKLNKPVKKLNCGQHYWDRIERLDNTIK